VNRRVESDYDDEENDQLYPSYLARGTHGLGLLVENGLGLTSVTALLSC